MPLGHGGRRREPLAPPGRRGRLRRREAGPPACRRVGAAQRLGSTPRTGSSSPLAPADDVNSTRGSAGRPRCDAPRQLDAVHLRHLHVEDREVEGARRLEPAQRLRRRPRVAQAMPHCAGCSARMRRLVALSSTTSMRLSASAGCTPPKSRRARGQRRRPARATRTERRAAARPSLSTHIAAHQLDQPLADRQTEPGAAVCASCRRRPGERLEEPRRPWAGMPMPVSRTAKQPARRPRRRGRSTVSTTSPASVNLTALPSRLTSTCRSARHVARDRRGTSPSTT